MLLVRFNIKINQETTRQSPAGGRIQPQERVEEANLHFIETQTPM